MRLVGATEGYIMRPFLVEGAITGLLGGLLALGLTRLTHSLVSRGVLRMDWLPDLWVVAGVAAAGLLGMGAAAFAVHRELRRRRVL